MLLANYMKFSFIIKKYIKLGKSCLSQSSDQENKPIDYEPKALRRRLCFEYWRSDRLKTQPFFVAHR